MFGNSPLYAAIDLGSNSFHMLVVRKVGDSVRALSRVKRKVRLASGLDENNNLSTEAINRGLDCLRLFAEQLEDIPAENVRIVGTATLRLAKNRHLFLAEAEKFLHQPIEIITGETEARIIYMGVMSTSCSTGNNLVIDIGGASTELIIGEKKHVKVLHSTQMGCVTWLSKYFADKVLSAEHFAQAVTAAKDVLAPYINEYLGTGFIKCMGASGTVQALQEIMIAKGSIEKVTLEKLYELRSQTIACGHLDSLHIEGLTPERLSVFPSGLAILIAIFEALHVPCMTLAGGALREGLIYSMLGTSDNKDVRERTIDSLMARYQIDKEQAHRVSFVALKIYDTLNGTWNFEDEESRAILHSAAMLHEIGLCIEYKKAPQHAAYIINNIDLPGFTPAQKTLLSALLINQRDSLHLEVLEAQNALSVPVASLLVRILRFALIICMSRNDDAYHCELGFTGEPNGKLIITLPQLWCTHYYLRSTELKLECSRQQQVGWPIEVKVE